MKYVTKLDFHVQDYMNNHTYVHIHSYVHI